MADSMDGTGGGLIAFLDYAGDKGLLTNANANAIKVGVREVLLHTQGEDWESKDVRALDVDDVMRRFEMKRATRYTPGSLKTYRSRFRNAMTMYQGFLQDPGGWRPSKPARAAAASTPRRRTTERTEEQPAPPQTPPQPVADDSHDRPDMMTYPFPLRRDGGVVFARLILPHDLTPKEADRIGEHIKTLAIDVPEPPKTRRDPQPAPEAPDPDPEPEPSNPDAPF
jgi:hypothetical protein